MPIYPGAREVLGDPSLQVAVYCLALADVPTGPTDLAALVPVILPYDPAPIAWAEGGVWLPQWTAGLIAGTVTFIHPAQSGPLLAKGIALVFPGETDWLLAVQPITNPVPTPAPGYRLDVSVDWYVLGPAGA